MSRPTTVFDTPQAKLFPDDEGVRQYGNISNRMEVVDGDRVFYVAVAVPTFLFSFMAEVAKVPQDVQGTLSLEQIDEFYVFSLLVGDTLYDLWPYTRNSRPAWVFSRDYRCS